MAKRKKAGRIEPRAGLKARFVIRQVVRECIGCGACAAVSRNWKVKGEKFIPRESVLGKLGKNLEAAEVCPVTCIHIIDKLKKKRLA
ncbi:MAG: hypothetical protein V1820_02020 [archaeon]